jgi:hypothetical protein
MGHDQHHEQVFEMGVMIRVATSGYREQIFGDGSE